ncbi:GIY-YIG nuclease family protein [Marinoscillum sp.]|uniref:GIY-YIG nuclease family protein n=1 Tax=Marinoscillum sp. TaxID=2024838 RepID=UPI003BABF2F0
MYYAYILKSTTYGTHYYGSSKDVQERLNQYNSGKVRYTNGRRPWTLIYSEVFDTRSEAVQRERFFKSSDGHNWLKSEGII